MHLLFVNPPSPRNRSIIRLIDCSHEAKADYLWQPGDFMLISALLSPDDGASLIDGTADRLGEADFFRLVAGAIRLIVFALSGVCWESITATSGDAGRFALPLLRHRGHFPEEAYLSSSCRNASA